MQTDLMEKLVSLSKRRGYVYPGSDIYGGLANSWDFGPLGIELRNNIKNEWWKSMVRYHREIVGLDAAIIMAPKVWEASGHTAGFTDPLQECKACHHRFRADHLAEEGVSACPDCGGELTEPRSFNLLMETALGTVEGEKTTAYLRGETAQGIYVNYKNVLDSSRLKLPFGIAQIGKAFRNEITPGNFVFRLREFEQMEMQYFVRPGQTKQYFEMWKKERREWYMNLGMNMEHLHSHVHEDDERAHYAQAAEDLTYDFPFGTKELEGIHDRGDYDLSNHQKHSGEDLSYFDDETDERFIPHIVETSVGVDRSMLAFMVDAFREEEIEGEKRTLLAFHPKLAPVKAAVMPLVKNKPKLTQKAKDVYDLLKADYMVQYDESGSIGRRYRRQDEIGTPFAITVDFETLDDQQVTVRHRDTLKQDRIAIAELPTFIREQLQ